MLDNMTSELYFFNIYFHNQSIGVLILANLFWVLDYLPVLHLSNWFVYEISKYKYQYDVFVSTFCLFFHMLVQEVEKDVKARTKGEMGAAKTLCSPLDQPDIPSGIVVVFGISTVYFLYCWLLS